MVGFRAQLNNRLKNVKWEFKLLVDEVKDLKTLSAYEFNRAMLAWQASDSPLKQFMGFRLFGIETDKGMQGKTKYIKIEVDNFGKFVCQCDCGGTVRFSERGYAVCDECGMVHKTNAREDFNTKMKKHIEKVGRNGKDS